MTRVLAVVKYVVEIDTEEFLNYSAEWYMRINEQLTQKDYKQLMGCLLSNVTWFPMGEFDPKLAEQRLVESNVEVDMNVKLWLAFTQKQCNKIKQAISYETSL